MIPPSAAILQISLSVNFHRIAIAMSGFEAGNIEICWLTLMHQARQKAQKILIANSFIGFVPLNDPLIGPPPHPFRLWRHAIID